MSDPPIAAVLNALDPERPGDRSEHRLQIAWYYLVAVALLHLLAGLALFPWFLSWTGVVLVPVGFYVFATLGSCLGFHRLLAHRSFSCSRWLERTLVMLGTCNLMLSPPYWVAIHRLHHRFADEDLDPHSPAKSFLGRISVGTS
jgi:fatty-acid desaturase